MSAPDPEAVDAVARAAFMAFHDQACPEGRHCEARDLHAQVYGWFDGRKMVDALLSPENAPILLRALAAAGHLTEEKSFAVQTWSGETKYAGFGMHPSDKPHRRYFSPWEPVP